MIAARHDNGSAWQGSFAALLPEIEGRLQRAFRRLDPAAREEATAEGVVHCLVAYLRLHDRGRAQVASAATLAFYAARHVRRGRPAAGRMNGKEPLSRYGQLNPRFPLQRRQNLDATHSEWISALVEDKRARVAEIVALRIDARQWLATLTRRTRRIAKDLAWGHSTSEVAQKHGLTPGRISQLRRSLAQSWAAFQNEATPAAGR